MGDNNGVSGSFRLSFANMDSNLLDLAEATKSTDTIELDPTLQDLDKKEQTYSFWNNFAGKMYQRHDVDTNNLNMENGAVTSSPDLGVEIVTVSYMLSEDTQEAALERLEEMASSSEGFIEIDETSGSTKGE